VAGRGARIALDFLEPGGAGTGRLLPTGRTRETIDGAEVSLVDATNPFVWVRAADVGLQATETPQAIDADRRVMERLEAIRVEAARRMGIPGSAAVPKVGVVAAPLAFTALDGVGYAKNDADLLARVISMGNCHRAVPLTAAMCLAVAARVPGTVVAECVASRDGDVRIGQPSGVLPVAATVLTRDGEPWAECVTVYRTARRLMEGFVRVP